MSVLYRFMAAHHLSAEEYNKIRRHIVKKLYAKQAFQHGHLLYERLLSGIHSHMGGLVRIVLDDLLKEGIVLYYGRTNHGAAYQLNIKKLREIESIIAE